MRRGGNVRNVENIRSILDRILEIWLGVRVKSLIKIIRVIGEVVVRILD